MFLNLKLKEDLLYQYSYMNIAFIFILFLNCIVCRILHIKILISFSKKKVDKEQQIFFC